jgi:hypothetical protein
MFEQYPYVFWPLVVAAGWAGASLRDRWHTMRERNTWKRRSSG